MPKDSRAKRERMREARRRARAAESDEARDTRLALNRARIMRARAAESDEERHARLARDRARRTYLRAKSSENRQPLERSSSTETCASVYYQYLLMMSSPNRVEWETSVQSSENETLQDNKVVMDRPGGQRRSIGIQVNTPETCTVTIEKPALQHIVDEEAIMQLMKTCPMCDRKCRCTKHTRGPYLIVYQNCYYCDFQRKWASQPEAINANAYKAYMPSRKKLKSNDTVTVEAEAQSSQLNTSISESSESNQPLQSCVTVSTLSLDVIDVHSSRQK